MKVLFIGGTGNISTSVSRMAVERGINFNATKPGTTESGNPRRTLAQG